MNPQTLFCKSQTSLQIQELLLNPEIFCKSEKIFCHVLLTPAVCHSQRFAASKMVELCLLFYLRGSKMNPGDKLCFKCGSKVAEISHPIPRISTPEDERPSSSSSTKSLSQREEHRGYMFMKQAKQQAGFKRNVSDPRPRIQFGF